MKFLALCHYDTDVLGRLTMDDFQEMGAISAPHDQALRASGHLIAVGTLAFPEQSKTVRREGTTVTIHDGPFSSTKNPVGQFFFIEANSMDEAITVAKLHPGMHLGEKFGPGSIEVRPVEMLDQIR